MADVHNPTFPVLARVREGAELPLSDAQVAGAAYLRFTDEDGNERLIGPAGQFNARIRIADGSAPYMRYAAT